MSASPTTVVAVSRPFRFAIQGGPFDDADALRRHATEVEAFGYKELYSYDHIGEIDPFLPLIVAAEATTMLRFGPAVINNEFHNPVLLARAAATFDRLTGGRLVLGMGTGYQRSEHDASDIELRPPGERVTRFGESLRVLRALLDTGRASFEGDHVRVEVDDLGIRPIQATVPLLVGGHGRRVVTLAGELADIFQFTGLTHDAVTGAPSAGGFARETIAERRRWLREAAAERFDAIELSALVQQTHIGDGADEARADAAERVGVDGDFVDDTPFALIGSVDQVVDKLHGLRDDLGINHFVVRDAEGFAPVVDALSGA